MAQNSKNEVEVFSTKSKHVRNREDVIESMTSLNDAQVVGLEIKPCKRDRSGSKVNTFTTLSNIRFQSQAVSETFFKQICTSFVTSRNGVTFFHLTREEQHLKSGIKTKFSESSNGDIAAWETRFGRA